MATKQIKVMVVDDMEAHRRRLGRAISAENDMLLAGTASNGEEAIILAKNIIPDIILMDIEMEEKLAGVNAAKEINSINPGIKIIMLTVHDDNNIVFAAFQTGIVDYVMKTTEVQEIIDAIRAAYKDLSPIRPIIAEKIRKEFQRSKTREESLIYMVNLISHLTPCELEVLQYLCDGKTRREIADIRYVSFGTIKKQINSILKKCEQKRTRELTRLIKDLKIYDVIKNI